MRRPLKDREGVGDIAGENRDGVERATGGDGADGSERRASASADDSVERGTRPDPAVWVAENGTRPATAVAEPELDPRVRRSARNALRGTLGRTDADEAGRELSRFVLPMTIAPARSSLDHERGFPGVIGGSGQAAVVGSPATRYCL